MWTEHATWTQKPEGRVTTEPLWVTVNKRDITWALPPMGLEGLNGIMMVKGFCKL